MKEIIEKEKIDLVVITGDLIDLYRSIDSKSAMLKGLLPILASNIPFVFTFGESDTDEFNNPHFRDEKVHIVNFLSSLSNCYNELPPISVREKSEIHGLTNYNLKVFNLDAKDGGELSLDNPHALITVLDSQDHKIAPSQMNYLYRQNDLSSLGNIFKLLFFHYPLPNFRPAGSFLLVGSYNEKHQLNSKSSAAFRDDIINCGYNVVSVGHEHQNDACLLSEDNKSDRKIWLCYNSVTGDSAKTDLIKDFDRRARIFEIDFQNQKLLSWKRGQGKGESFHYQLIHAF